MLIQQQEANYVARHWSDHNVVILSYLHHNHHHHRHRQELTDFFVTAILSVVLIFCYCYFGPSGCEIGDLTLIKSALKKWFGPGVNFICQKSPHWKEVEKMLIHVVAETQSFQGLIDQNDRGKAWDNWVEHRPNFKSALRVVKMVLDRQYNIYLWLTMWFHAEKSTKTLKNQNRWFRYLIWAPDLRNHQK